MPTPDTINVYKLYDPLDIQLLRLDMEQAAVDTGDFTAGYTTLQIYDNGFWTLTNDLPPLYPTVPEAGRIEEAQAAAELWMKNFDTILAGSKKTNSWEQSEAYLRMLETIHPDNHPAKPPKFKKTNKPAFFEHVQYIGGRSMTVEIDRLPHIYYRLVYGIQLKPSKDEDPVMVEDVEVVIEVWDDGGVRKVEYRSLAVKDIEKSKRLSLDTTALKLCYEIDTFSLILIPIAYEYNY